MSFVRQFDSDINPIILDVSKYNLGRYGRRRLLYMKEHHSDVYTTMIFEVLSAGTWKKSMTSAACASTM